MKFFWDFWDRFSHKANHQEVWPENNNRCTGKSFTEALILASVNPQYDERLFIELQEKYKLRT
jgi:hypothetical protein